MIFCTQMVDFCRPGHIYERCMHESRVEHGVTRLSEKQGKSYNLENFSTKLQLVAKFVQLQKFNSLTFSSYIAI